ncbi:MAG: hypothetical protein C4305_04800, partial [Thermoleophilia bacterium]
GATISQAARSGAAVEVLTVFAGEPASQAPASPWARRAGFRTEGEEVRARRGEDAAACALLGARQRWLAFGDAPYDRRGGEEEIFSAVAEACAGADVVVIPGFPLEHEDHAWLSPLLLGNGLPQAGPLRGAAVRVSLGQATCGPRLPPTVRFPGGYLDATARLPG